ncbi:MAG: TrmH family RNA methyltransferase [Myxococcales bacterium]|nr:TrmH family RNA methyltransferase [Myxococcales bacterium]
MPLAVIDGPKSAFDVLRRALATSDPESVIAVLEPLTTDERRARLASVAAHRLRSVTVVMDAPHDPHNGAAVLRSCDAFGVQRVHVVERAEVFRARADVSKGSERWVDIVHHADVASAAGHLEAEGFTLVGTDPNGALLPEDLSRFERLALVMGNERDGICDALRSACREHVRIPMRGFVESLNVSVSAATLLAFATSGRAGDHTPIERRRLYARWLAQSVPRALEILAVHDVFPTDVFPTACGDNRGPVA